jgi:2-keto-4-pentenoate hydratase/2-oxohepta-3-ene-1,7-dioic acid hydratase in catechol pathway
MRIGNPGEEMAAALVEGDRYVDLSDLETDLGETFLSPAGLAALNPTIAERVRNGSALPLAGRRVGAPITRPHQILCIGLNYSDHAAETGQAIPAEPIIFHKSPNTLIGPNDDVQIPRGSTKTDWEVELGVVIGSRATNLRDESEAEGHIAGYVVVNDVSERAFQLERGGQWTKGKSAPTFNPAGPYLVTQDEIDDVLSLGMWLDVDGVRRQNGSTATMLFSPAYIVWYLSQFMTLEPGDLINTGTPPGVGMGLTPPRYLHGGELITLGIDGLGAQSQRVLADTTRSQN